MSTPQEVNRNYQPNPWYVLALVFVPLSIFFTAYSYLKPPAPQTNNSNTQVTKPPTPPTQKCVGSENCISKVRLNFESTGKKILSEQYLNNGEFGISFLDLSRGEAFNANVKTDCNCEILGIDVDRMR
jgi:hypothetical protein